MKLLKFLIIFIIINNVFINCSNNVCSQDYHCNLPYEYCANNWNVDARSIGLGRDGKVYFTARNNVNNDSGKLGPSYLVSVLKNPSSSNPGTNVVLKITDEIPNGPVYNRVNGIAGVNQLPNGKFMIIQDMYKYLPLYGTFDSLTNKFTTAFKQNFENSIFIEGNTMYRCIDTRLESVTPVPLDIDQPIGTTNSTTLYNTNYCLGLVKVGSNLYFTQRIQIADKSIIGFYITVANCKNCNPPSPIFSVTDSIVYCLAGDSKYFYYSTANGLFRVGIDGDVSKRLKLSDNPNIKGIALDSESNAIFYASSYTSSTGTIGSSIVRISLDNQAITVLYDSSYNVASNIGECECVSAFTGDQCTNCNGTINWEQNPITLDNYPVCYPFTQSGQVSFCKESWQCLNSPFNYCSTDNTCLCRSGFTGSRCEICLSKNISWNDQGIPTCN